MGWGGDRLCQTSPIPRSPDGDKNLNFNGSKIEGEFDDVCTWMVQRTYKGKFHFCRGIVGKNV